MARQFLVRAVFEAGWYMAVGCAFGVGIALQGFFGSRPQYDASLTGLLGRLLVCWLVIFALCTGVLRGKLQRAFLRDVIFGLPWLAAGLAMVYFSYSRPEDVGEPFSFISWFAFLALGTLSYLFRDRVAPPASESRP